MRSLEISFLIPTDGHLEGIGMASELHVSTGRKSDRR